jgi:hypothetical protein
MFEVAFALIVTLASVAAIYLSWKQRNKMVLAWVGWLLAVASLPAWSVAFGPEFGVTYATIVFVGLVWLRVALDMDFPGAAKAGAAANQRPYRALNWPSASIATRHVVMFLLSVPATGVLALLLSVSIVWYLPWTLLTRGAVAIFLYPVLWGAISGWICTQKKLMKPALLVAGLFIVCSLILFV